MNAIKLLVPTDFSGCARNALDYAIGLASELKAEIILLHSITYSDSTLLGNQAMEERNMRIYNASKEHLDREVEYAKSKNSSLDISGELDADNAELAITNLIERKNITYVVMGTEGASGVKAAIFGSFTNSVLLISPIPVFTIPVSAKFKGIKFIVCTTEMDELENNAVMAIVKIAEQQNAQLVFYNVNSNEDEQTEKFYKFQRYIKTLSSHPLIDYVVIESKDVLGSIEDYVCERSPDLVVTLGKEESFFEKLFGKKVTKQLCLHTSVPLLSFPVHYNYSPEREPAKAIRK